MTPAPPSPAAPAPRVLVRIGAGRATPYEFADDEFLVGGAAGCDLRIAGANLPPVACRFTRTTAGVSVRKLTPSCPVALNGVPLPGTETVAVRHADRVTVGPAELVLDVPAAVFFTPKLIAATDDDLEDREADEHETALARRLAAIKAEVDRYERRRAGFAAEETALARREAVAAEYEARLDRARADLERLQPPIRPDDTEARRQALETEYRTRFEELEANFARRIDALEAEFAAADAARRAEAAVAARSSPDQEQYQTDLARLDRWQASLETRQLQLDRRAAEVDARAEQLRRDTGELEEQVRLADAANARAAADAERYERRKAELDDRHAALAERAEALETQQAALAVLRAKLDRTQEDARAEAAALADDRAKTAAARADLDARLRDAERLRAELGSVKDDHESRRRAVVEEHALLAAAVADIEGQKAAAAATTAALAEKERDLDARAADVAEQAAIVKARATQVRELHDRLEADRLAVKDREAALTDAETARQTLQEQLRKRAEEINLRAKQYDDATQALAAARAAADADREALAVALSRSAESTAVTDATLSTRAAEVDRKAAALADREAALARQVERVKEVGRAVAEERKSLAGTRTAWDGDREKHAAEFAAMLAQLPGLDESARVAQEQLAAARELVRGQLAELHTFATQTRQDLDAARTQLRAADDDLRRREGDLERGRSDHRLAVAGFRQQLLDWQATVTGLKQAMAVSELRVHEREVEVSAAAEQATATTEELARREEELRAERRLVAEKRTEIERHLGDMREWYRRKLRELAAGRPLDDSDMPGDAPRPLAATAADGPPADPDPGDRHLGELLKTRGLIDPDALNALWHEATRQRKTLRNVLLASGAVTLYQLAMIEAGNLDALVLGRLRVIDRVRATPRESVFRVFDPTRPGGPTRGVYVLRHLSEADAADAVRPDEFRQRFAGAMTATHPNLVNTLEVLDINSRPAAIQEYAGGLPSTDWPAAAAVPGVWVKLLSDAARAINHAHRAGLVHGRLTPETVVLTADGVVKILGVGDPPWLTGQPAAYDPPPAVDLQGLGRLAFGWSQLGGKKRTPRAKPFPPTLARVIRRLESGAEPPMADVVSFDRPYADAAELVRDLARLADDHPLPADGWEKLTRHVAETLPAATPLRQSA